MRSRLVFASLTAAVVLVSCGGDSTAPATPVTPVTKVDTTHVVTPVSNVVTVENNDFSPSTQTITAGQTVTWKWSSCSAGGTYGDPDACVSHGVVFDDGASSAVQSEGSYNRTFPDKGTFSYHCPIHGTSMSGTITVQ